MHSHLASLPTVKAFLNAFPRNTWKYCIESCLIIGIHRANRIFPSGASLEELWNAARMTEEYKAKKKEVVKSADISPRMKHAKSKIRDLVIKDIQAFKERNRDSERRKPRLKIPEDAREYQYHRYDPSCLSARTPSLKTRRNGNEALRIADQFLKNPFTSQLVGVSALPSPRSPSYRSIISNDSKFLQRFAND